MSIFALFWINIATLLLISSAHSADSALLRFPAERVSPTTDQHASIALCEKILVYPQDFEVQAELFGERLHKLAKAKQYRRYAKELVARMNWFLAVRANHVSIREHFIRPFAEQLVKSRLYEDHGLSKKNIIRVHMLLLEYAQEHGEEEISELIILHGIPEFLDPFTDGVGRNAQWRANWLNAWVQFLPILKDSPAGEAILDEARRSISRKAFEEPYIHAMRVLESRSVSKHRKAKVKQWIIDVNQFITTLFD